MDDGFGWKMPIEKKTLTYIIKKKHAVALTIANDGIPISRIGLPVKSLRRGVWKYLFGRSEELYPIF